MDGALVLFAISGLFFAGVVKGATGIGYSSCALPFLVATLGLQPAIVLLVVPAMASNILVLFSAGHFRASVRKFWPLYLATLPGILLGIALLVVVDKRVPTQVLGALICLYAVQAWLKPDLVIGPKTARLAQVPVGLLNGLFTGFTGSQVMPLMPYMLSLKLESDRFVQAVNIAVVVASVFLGVGLWRAGLMSPSAFTLSTLAVIPALVGVRLGTWTRQHIPTTHFRVLVLLVLFLIGATLLIRA